MDSVDALQARREAQAQARCQTHAHNRGSVAGQSNLLYAALVPPPGVSQPPPVPPPGVAMAPTTAPDKHSRASTPSSTVTPRPDLSASGHLASSRGWGNTVDYSAQSGVFIPEGVRVTPPSSPATADIESAAEASVHAPVYPVSSDARFVAPPVRQNTRPLEDVGALSKLTPSQLATLMPRNGLMQGYVLRERGGFLTNPKYRFFMEPRDVFVMASRRRSKKQSSNYVVSLDESDLDRDSDFCFAKVRSNFTGTEFVFFTSDRDDKKELGAVLYEVNPGGIRGPRRMTVIVPRLGSNGVAEEWRCTDEAGGLIEEYRSRPDSNKLIVLENKAPQWNEALKGFQLNFGGRIGMPSVKNFQLCDCRDQAQNVVLQFGKWSADRFSLDFRYPINATQAFCIALTSFDNKLLCE